MVDSWKLVPITEYACIQTTAMRSFRWSVDSYSQKGSCGKFSTLTFMSKKTEKMIILLVNCKDVFS